MPVHAELTAQADRRRGERDGVAFVHRAGDEGVVRPVVEHAGAARPHRRDGIDHGGKRVELELDKIGKVLGLGAGRLHAGNDRLADIAHPFVGQRRVGAVTVGGELGAGFEDVERPDVGQGEDVAGGARRPDHAADVRMRHVAADKGHVLHTGNPEVGNEHAVAEEMPGVLLAQHARSDPTAEDDRNDHVRLLFPLATFAANALRNAVAQALSRSAKQGDRPSRDVKGHQAASRRSGPARRMRRCLDTST